MSSAAKKSASTARLAAFGKSVARALKKHPRVELVAAGGVELFVCQHFMTDEECAGIIALIDADAYPSTLYQGTEVDGYRTSYSCNLDRHQPLVARIEARICGLMGIDPRHGETLQGQRYQPGQLFKPHHDFFFTSEPYWESERKSGQRSWTAMIYLNEPEAGGETNFPKVGMCVSPRSAMLLLWNNMDASGAPNILTLHEGMPVEIGTKYIVTKWFRERFWG